MEEDEVEDEFEGTLGDVLEVKGIDSSHCYDLEYDLMPNGGADQYYYG